MTYQDKYTEEELVGLYLKYTDETLVRIYLDWVNNFLTVTRYAEYYGIDETEALWTIEEGRRLHGEQCKLANTYFGGNGRRECRACGREVQRKRYLKQKEKALCSMT